MNEEDFCDLILTACTDSDKQAEAEQKYKNFLEERPNECCNLLISLISSPNSEITKLSASLLRVALSRPNDNLNEYILSDDYCLTSLFNCIQQDFPNNINDTLCDSILFVIDIKNAKKIDTLYILDDIIGLTLSESSSISRSALTLISGILYRVPLNQDYYELIAENISNIHYNKTAEYELISKTFEVVFALSFLDFNVSHFFEFLIDWIRTIDNKQKISMLSHIALFYNQVTSYLQSFAQQFFNLIIEFIFSENATDDIINESLYFLGTLSLANYENLAQTDFDIDVSFDSSDHEFTLGKVISLLICLSEYFGEDYDVIIDEASDNSVGSVAIDVIGTIISNFEGVSDIFAKLINSVNDLLENDFNKIVAGLKLLPLIFRHGIECFSEDEVNSIMETLFTACDSDDERIKYVGLSSLQEVVDDFDKVSCFEGLDLDNWCNILNGLIYNENDPIYFQVLFQIFKKITISFPNLLKDNFTSIIDILKDAISTDDEKVISDSLEIFIELMNIDFENINGILPNIDDVIQQIFEREQYDDLYFIALKSLSELLLKTKDEDIFKLIANHLFEINIEEIHFSHIDYYHVCLNSLIETGLIDIGENITCLFNRISALLMDQPEPIIVKKINIEDYYESHIIANSGSQDCVLYEMNHVFSVRNMLDIINLIIPYILDNGEYLERLFGLYTYLLDQPIRSLILGNILKGIKKCEDQRFAQTVVKCIIALVSIADNFENIKECIPHVHDLLYQFIQNAQIRKYIHKIINSIICICYCIEVYSDKVALQASLSGFITDNNLYEIERHAAEMVSILFEFYAEEITNIVQNNIHNFSIEPIPAGKNVHIHFLYIEILAIFAKYNSNYDYKSLFDIINNNYESLIENQQESALRVFVRLIPLSEDIEEQVFPIFSSYLENRMEASEFIFLTALHNASNKSQWAQKFNELFNKRFTRSSLNEFIGRESFSLKAVHDMSELFIDLIDNADPKPSLRQCILNIVDFLKKKLKNVDILDDSIAKFLQLMDGN